MLIKSWEFMYYETQYLHLKQLKTPINIVMSFQYLLNSSVLDMCKTYNIRKEL